MYTRLRVYIVWHRNKHSLDANNPAISMTLLQALKQVLELFAPVQ